MAGGHLHSAFSSNEPDYPRQLLFRITPTSVLFPPFDMAINMAAPTINAAANTPLRNPYLIKHIPVLVPGL